MPNFRKEVHFFDNSFDKGPAWYSRFFAPTDYQKERQAISTTWLRDLYFVQHRGLLSDGHVRNLEDLVDGVEHVQHGMIEGHVDDLIFRQHA